MQKHWEEAPRTWWVCTTCGKSGAWRSKMSLALPCYGCGQPIWIAYDQAAVEAAYLIGGFDVAELVLQDQFARRHEQRWDDYKAMLKR